MHVNTIEVTKQRGWVIRRGVATVRGCRYRRITNPRRH